MEQEPRETNLFNGLIQAISQFFTMLAGMFGGARNSQQASSEVQATPQRDPLSGDAEAFLQGLHAYEADKEAEREQRWNKAGEMMKDAKMELLQKEFSERAKYEEENPRRVFVDELLRWPGGVLSSQWSKNQEKSHEAAYEAWKNGESLERVVEIDSTWEEKSAFHQAAEVIGRRLADSLDGDAVTLAAPPKKEDKRER